MEHYSVPKYRAPGINIPEPVRVHEGPIPSMVAGRTDHLPATVRSGSYVLPSDVVGALGENNTAAGFAHIRRLFGGTPYGGGKAPYGQSHGLYGMMAKGGHAKSDESLVPVVLAGGEHVLSPEQVRDVGEGDIDKGHKVLDGFVLEVRKRNVKTLRKLPPPSKN
jgi:hypothetical protein